MQLGSSFFLFDHHIFCMLYSIFQLHQRARPGPARVWNMIDIKLRYACRARARAIHFITLFIFFPAFFNKLADWMRAFQITQKKVESFTQLNEHFECLDFVMVILCVAQFGFYNNFVHVSERENRCIWRRYIPPPPRPNAIELYSTTDCAGCFVVVVVVVSILFKLYDVCCYGIRINFIATNKAQFFFFLCKSEKMNVCICWSWINYKLLDISIFASFKWA